MSKLQELGKLKKELKEELSGTLNMMHLIDNSMEWKEIREEILIGVTSDYEITEILLEKLNKWVINNQENYKVDLFEMCYNELFIVWEQIKEIEGSYL